MATEIDKKVAQSLREQRLLAGYSLTKLSEMSGLGLSRASMHNLERGRQTFSINQYFQLKKVLPGIIDIGENISMGEIIKHGATLERNRIIKMIQNNRNV